MINKKDLKFKRPDFVIFTDKDGTLNLNDEQLNQILFLVKKEGGMIIPITGRTVGDIEESLRKANVTMPEFLIGDNGAVVYSTQNKDFIFKKVLDIEKIKKIINRFIEVGGNKANIRLTDGASIHAQDSMDVKRYYKGSKKVKYHENITEDFLDVQGITKVTLAGTEEQMQDIIELASKLDLWTDKDKTKFPTREQNNFRLDIAERNINKGEAVKALVSILTPRFGYACIGNGFNDVAMFEQALKDGMRIGIMKGSPEELIQEMKEYAREHKGKVKIIPQDINLANRYIVRLINIFKTRKRTMNFKERLKFTPPNNIKAPKQNNSTPKRNTRRRRNRGRTR